MRYQEHYDRLIDRARSRQPLMVYAELHHVLPRCMGGSDDPSNIVELTAEEHYVAHQLLVKIHPGHAGLALAALAMSMVGRGRVRPKNKMFGWLRRRFSAATRGRKKRPRTPEEQERMRLLHTGRKRKPITGQRIGDRLRGRKRKAFTDETRAKMRKPKSLEHRAKLAAILVERNKTLNAIPRERSIINGQFVRVA